MKFRRACWGNLRSLILTLVVVFSLINLLAVVALSNSSVVNNKGGHYSLLNNISIEAQQKHYGLISEQSSLAKSLISKAQRNMVKRTSVSDSDLLIPNLLQLHSNAGNYDPYSTLDSLTNHSPIIISSNSDFASLATSEGWQGSGTAEDPYIIENYYIAPNSSEIGIQISNTDVYFVIRNIYINSGNMSISLNNVSNGKIIEATFYDPVSKFIVIDGSHNIEILSCKFDVYSMLGKMGVSIRNLTHDILIFNCSFNTLHVAVDLTDLAYEVVIENNYFITNFIAVNASNGVKDIAIRNNYFANATGCDGRTLAEHIETEYFLDYGVGLYLNGVGENISVVSNTFSGFYGILLNSFSSQGTSLRIINNSFIHSFIYAASFVHSVFITDNTMLDSKIFARDSADMVIQGNEFSDCPEIAAIELIRCLNVDIIANDVHDSGIPTQEEHGSIIARESRYIVLKNNTFRNLDWAGIVVYDDSSFSVIEYNSFYYVPIAIALPAFYNDTTWDLPYNNVIRFNYIEQVSNIAIDISGNNNTLYHNYISNCAFIGMKLISVSDSSIYENIISDTTFAISFSGTISETLQNIKIYNNVLYKVDRGLRISSAENVLVLNNTFYSRSWSTYNTFGIEVGSCYNATILYNTIENFGYYGVTITLDSRSAVLRFNNFIKNGGDYTSEAYDNGQSSYIKNNYWSDNDGIDGDGDGITDMTYPIDGNARNFDYAPLAYPIKYGYPIRKITPPSVNFPNGGETLSGTENIAWQPSVDSWNETIYYSLYYSSDNGKNWTLIVANYTETNYLWDTTVVPDGNNYLIKVIAYISPEIYTFDVSDQTFTIKNSQSQDSETLGSTIVVPAPSIYMALISLVAIVSLIKRRIKP